MFTDAGVRPLLLPLARPLRTAAGRVDARNVRLFWLRDADGVTGVGEAAPWTGAGTESPDLCARMLDRATRWVVEQRLDLSFPGAWEPELERRLHGTPATRHAVSLALYDWWGRRQGLSLATLLGGGGRARSHWLVTSDAEAQVCVEAELAARRGFSVFKIKVDRDVERAARRIDALSSVVPHAEVRVDAGGCFERVEQVLAAIRRWSPSVALLEDPFPPGSYDQWRSLREQTPLDIAVDAEVDSVAHGLHLLRLGISDVLVLKPMRMGSPLACVRLAALARDFETRCYVTHMIDGPVARAAAVAAATAVDPDGVHGLAGAHLFAESEDEPSVLETTGRAGHGVEWNGLELATVVAPGAPVASTATDLR